MLRSHNGTVCGLVGWGVCQFCQDFMPVRALFVPPGAGPCHLPGMKKPPGMAVFCSFLLERAKGFEPSTPTLARLCSTPELRPRPWFGRGTARPNTRGIIAGAVAFASAGMTQCRVIASARAGRLQGEARSAAVAVLAAARPVPGRVRRTSMIDRADDDVAAGSEGGGDDEHQG
jgi:hypothetical protein